MNQPNILALVGLALGIAIAGVGINPLWGVGTFLIIGVAYIFSRRRELLILLASLVAGFFYWDIRVPEPPRPVSNPVMVELTGVVRDYPRIVQDKFSFNLECDQAPTGMKKVRVVGYFSTPVERGDLVRVKGRLREVREPGNPGEFDYKRYLARRNIYYTLTVRKPEHIQVLSDRRGWTEQLVLLARKRGMAAIEAALPAREAALLEGMVLGKSEGIDAEDYLDFQKTGLVHLLAVSGLNVGFVVLLAAWLASMLRLPERERLGLAALAIFGYGCLAGWPVSLLRASVMAWLGLLAYYSGREKNLLNALAVAGVILLLINPAWLFEISFQLSLLATWGLVYLYPVFRDRLPGQERLKDLVLVPLAAQLATLPVVVHHFGLFSLSSIIANLLGVYLAGFAVIAGLCGLLTGLVSASLAAVFVLPAGLAVDTVAGIARWLADLPGSYLWVGQPPGWSILLYYGGLVLLARGMEDSARRRVVAGGIMIVFFLAMALVTTGWGERGKLKITFLDVGQGDSLLVKTPRGRFLLVDSGGSQFWDVGNQVVLPALYRQGIRKLDMMVVTHPDVDHMGGAGPVLEEMPVRILGVSATTYPDKIYRDLDRLRAARGIPVIKLARGQRLALEPGLKIEVLHPPVASRSGAYKAREEYNSSSVVMRVCYGRISFLLMGDVDRSVMEELVAGGLIQPTTVVKVPHHGSRGSLSEAFYATAAPRVAVISVGANNMFGHPSPETLALLHRLNTKVFRTDRDGAVTLVTDGRSLWARSVK